MVLILHCCVVNILLSHTCHGLKVDEVYFFAPWFGIGYLPDVNEYEASRGLKCSFVIGRVLLCSGDLPLEKHDTGSQRPSFYTLEEIHLHHGVWSWIPELRVQPSPAYVQTTYRHMSKEINIYSFNPLSWDSQICNIIVD